MTGSKDTTCHVHALDPIPGFRIFRLVGHRDALVQVAFAKENMEVVRRLAHRHIYYNFVIAVVHGES